MFQTRASKALWNHTHRRDAERSCSWGLGRHLWVRDERESSRMISGTGSGEQEIVWHSSSSRERERKKQRWHRRPLPRLLYVFGRHPKLSPHLLLLLLHRLPTRHRFLDRIPRFSLQRCYWGCDARKQLRNNNNNGSSSSRSKDSGDRRGQWASERRRQRPRDWAWNKEGDGWVAPLGMCGSTRDISIQWQMWWISRSWTSSRSCWTQTTSSCGPRTKCKPCMPTSKNSSTITP